MGRIEQLREFIAKSPADPFPRYGLAIELKNSGQLEAAVSAFADLVARFPDYTAAYLHAGGALLVLGRKDEAIQVFQTGIEACVRKRDSHTKGELEAALTELLPS